MKKALLFVIGILCINSLYAQYSISGNVKDTSLSTPVRNASVVVFGKYDSILHSFTRTNSTGAFNLKLKDTGTFYLLISHPKFADIKEIFKIDNQNTNVKKEELAVTSRVNMLKEAIVRAKAGSIKVKGDTLIYMADSFQVTDGANVEELLTQLPGIEVDADGNIKAQGQKVQKVLVDGDEFFGDDPTVATKNLDAKIVDKVEVFDQKSDQASFTGFDDGEKSKTINLKLKEGMNKGVFGKVDLASNFDNRWNNKAMINAFKNKRKISALFINSSTYDNDLSWQDRNKYENNDDNTFYTEDGMTVSYRYNDGEDEGSSEEGLPTFNKASVNYSNKFLDNKLTFSVNGGYQSSNVFRNENSNNNSYFDGLNINYRSNTIANSTKQQLNAGTRLEWKIDSSTTLKANFKIVNSEIDKTETVLSNNIRTGVDTISGTNRNTAISTEKNNIDGTISLLKKLKKKGRTVSLSHSITQNDKQGSNQVNAVNNLNGFLQNQAINSKVDNMSSTNNSRIVYTEPLKADKLLMELNYALAFNNGNQKLNTYQIGTETRIDSLSNNFVSNNISNRAGVKFRWNFKKYNFAIGSDVARIQFNQKDEINNLTYNYNRFNIFPSINYKYKISQSAALNIDYNGSTRQPTLMQLQPLLNIQNPLNIVKGNPNLTQSFSQSVNINFWNYKMISERSFWMGAYLSNVFNQIASTTSFDVATARNISSYENINGYFSLSTWAGYGKKINKHFSYDINSNCYFTNAPYINNNIKRNAKSFDIQIQPSLRYKINTKLNASISSALNPQWNNNGIQKTKFWNIIPSFKISYLPIKAWKINTDITHTFQTANVAFNSSFNRTIWNAYTSYKIIKKYDLSLTARVNDILNQNTGYTRSFNNNTTYESNNLTLKRYGMLGVLWNFNTSKNKKEEEPKADGDDMEF